MKAQHHPDGENVLFSPSTNLTLEFTATTLASSTDDTTASENLMPLDLHQKNDKPLQTQATCF